jgi:hypothetical protein
MGHDLHPDPELGTLEDWETPAPIPARPDRGDDARPAAADDRRLDQLPDAPDIDVARAFYVAGDSHLLMNKNDRSTDLNLVRGDCQGWTKLASLTTVENATGVVPYQVADQTFALFS